MYVSDDRNDVVRVLDTATGQQRVIAGNGTPGFSGDGGPATAAQLSPGALVVDPAGNVLVADAEHHRVRRIDAQTGRISTIVGTGVGAYSGDGGPATAAKIASPSDLALDNSGNLYIADAGNARLRKVTSVGTITTLAGIGVRGETGDGGPAVVAQIDGPWSLTVNILGEVFIVGSNRIRKIGLTGIITTVAGTGQMGVNGPNGDGGPALQAAFEGSETIEADTHGNLFVSEYAKVRKIDAQGIITTVAGNRQTLFAGDGGPAVQAAVVPRGLAFDGSDNLYIASPDHARVRRMATNGTISTVFGNGTRAFSGMGGPARDAQIGGPFGSITAVTTDGVGNVFVGLYSGIVRIDAQGTATLMAGKGEAPYMEFGGDGGPATQARLGLVSGLAADGLGNLFLADPDNHRVRRIDPSGTITTVAGTGAAGFGGDGGPATQARLNRPVAVALDATGNLFISDSENHRVRRVDLAGAITTVAGNGVRASGGDGGPATQAQLDYPSFLAVDPAGAVHVLEAAGTHLRRVAPGPSGTISLVPTAGIAPTNLTFDAAGQLYVVDSFASMTNYTDIRARVLRITGTTATVVAGVGPEGFSGDGGPAPAAQLSRVRGIAFDPAGNLVIADYGNGKIRQVEGVGPRRDSVVFSWGLSANGQLGHDPGGPSVPVGVGGVGVDGAIVVRAGTAHSVALSADGTVSTWGFGMKGQLGTGSKADASRPVVVKGLTDVKAIGTGYLHTLAVRQDGSVMAWGWNEFAQLGLGQKSDSAVPVAVPGLADVIAVAGGATHSLALKADGTVWAWGLNHVGQLGTGAAAESTTPVQVPKLTGVVAIAAGAFHSVALTDDGTVWTWGWNIFGQLGTGLTLDQRTPVAVTGVSGVTGIAVGGFHTLVVKGDGTVWGFGLNHLGQLGAGAIVKLSPAAMPGLTGVRDVAGGAFHSLAITTGGSVVAWGFNGYGQLGTGTLTNSVSPVPVVVVRNAVGVAGGAAHSLVATATS